MPKSATGTSTTEAPPPWRVSGGAGRASRSRRDGRLPRGFTLLEIMVVTVIIGIVASATLLSLSARGTDRELDRESRRLAALVELAAEEAVLQGRELGLELFDRSYRFHVYSPAEGQWSALELDRQFRLRTLPEGVDIALHLEGRRAQLANAPEDAARPQILLSSSGEMTPFRLELTRSGRSSRAQLIGEANGRLQLEHEGQ